MPYYLGFDPNKQAFSGPIYESGLLGPVGPTIARAGAATADQLRALMDPATYLGKPATFPAAPQQPPQTLDPISLALLGGGGGLAPMRLGSSSIPLPKNNMGALTQELAALKSPELKAPIPTAQGEDAFSSLLQGMSANAGLIDPAAPTSDMLLKLGLGALGGVGKAQGEAKRTKRADEQALLEFQNQAARQAYSDRLAQLSAQIQASAGQQGTDLKLMELMRPTASGGTAIIPQLQGEKINYNVQTLPQAGGAHGKNLAAALTPTAIYNELALTAPTELMKAASAVGLGSSPLKVTGLNDTSTNTVAQGLIVDWLRQNSPNAFQELQRRAIMKALGGQ